MPLQTGRTENAKVPRQNEPDAIKNEACWMEGAGHIWADLERDLKGQVPSFTQIACHCHQTSGKGKDVRGAVDQDLNQTPHRGPSRSCDSEGTQYKRGGRGHREPLRDFDPSLHL